MEDSRGVLWAEQEKTNSSTAARFRYSLDFRRNSPGMKLRSRLFPSRPSNPHRHHDVTVLVVLAIGGTQLSGGLRVFEFQFHVRGPAGLQEVQDVLCVEANRKS